MVIICNEDPGTEMFRVRITYFNNNCPNSGVKTRRGLKGETQWQTFDLRCKMKDEPAET